MSFEQWLAAVSVVIGTAAIAFRGPRWTVRAAAALTALGAAMVLALAAAFSLFGVPAADVLLFRPHLAGVLGTLAVPAYVALAAGLIGLVRALAGGDPPSKE